MARHKQLTFSAVENMKRAAKKLRKAEGIPHHAALDQVARANGFANWRAVTVAAAVPVDVVVCGDGLNCDVICTRSAGAEIGRLAELAHAVQRGGAAD